MSPQRGWLPVRCAAIVASAVVLTLVSPAMPAVADTTADEAGALILTRFPMSEEWYRPPAAELIRAGIVERYGAEEWRAVVLSHELHQHIGIYTILGAKMGVRARELLKAPTRSVRATLETGGNGPMTCAADGIQASLASTFGQDLVHVESPLQPVLAGTFEYDGRRLRLALKPEYRSVMQGHVDRARERHGDLSPAYFQELERISYTVWSDFDRSEVFSVEWADR